jgi:hypothetical protein
MRHVFHQAELMPFYMKERTIGMATTNDTIRQVYQFTCLFLLILNLLAQSFNFEFIVQAKELEATVHIRSTNVDTEKMKHERRQHPTVRMSSRHEVNVHQVTISPNFWIIQQSEANLLRPQRRRIQNAACSENPGCAAAGLVNDCCPNSEGKVLECCSLTLPPSTLCFRYF